MNKGEQLLAADVLQRFPQTNAVCCFLAVAVHAMPPDLVTCVRGKVHDEQASLCSS